jgi:hypothetical protein
MKAAIILKDPTNKVSFTDSITPSILITNIFPEDKSITNDPIKTTQKALMRLLQNQYSFVLEKERLNNPFIYNNIYTYIYPLKAEEIEGFKTKLVTFITIPDLIKKFNMLTSESSDIIKSLAKDPKLLSSVKIPANSLIDRAPIIGGDSESLESQNGIYYSKYLNYKIKFLESQKKILDLEQKIKSYNI